ncbi:hypothetical protein [Lactiplantibacillus herbarum]|uniref:hypothetical protein n=1 Tax=Lactiplantibacillus herbarum TaxID=1670446 RepID=UPI00064F14F6|nr:hypothetical protein [Lactiplantibacillus herbarum]
MIIRTVAPKTVEPFLIMILDRQRQEQLALDQVSMRVTKGLAMYDGQYLVGGLLMHQIDKQVKITTLAVLANYRH